MADERSAFPGDTESAGGSAAGRTPDRWLDRETAELLLRGESLEAVDPADRAQAERLAKALGALSVDPSPAKVELPGEEAALAAFRATRNGNDVERFALGRPGRAQSSDAGLVRLGRPAPAVPGSRWGRPVRFGLTAAVAVGMIGGVAAAAGTGVLPTPFDDHPAPAASISAEATPDHPFGSPSPSGTGGSDTPATSGGSDDSSGEAAGSGTDSTPSAGAGDDKSAGAGNGGSGLTSSCRALRDGKSLDAGRKRTLAGAAGGTSHVGTYCKGLLKSGGSGTDDKNGTDDKGGKGDKGDKGDSGNGASGSVTNGGAQGGDQGVDNSHMNPIAPGGSGSSGDSGSGNGGHQDNGASATTTHRTPDPSPTYSAL
ncbi:hypothetical protein ABZT04_05690 [Streptomyces sp. NPDC005492]|uniref:hypothetical protein n=1 Tax=Streptomyces sp. NPDC005492 TaxID=3156883 RepID=UPI0033B03BC7